MKNISNIIIPDYLLRTYDMLRCAFPDGVKHDDYLPLLAALAVNMSDRNAATIVSLFADRDYAHSYNDVLRVQSTDIPDPADVLRVKQRLLACGYENWLKEE